MAREPTVTKPIFVGPSCNLRPGTLQLQTECKVQALAPSAGGRRSRRASSNVQAGAADAEDLRGSQAVSVAHLQNFLDVDFADSIE